MGKGERGRIGEGKMGREKEKEKERDQILCRTCLRGEKNEGMER